MKNHSYTEIKKISYHKLPLVLFSIFILVILVSVFLITFFNKITTLGLTQPPSISLPGWDFKFGQLKITPNPSLPAATQPTSEPLTNEQKEQMKTALDENSFQKLPKILQAEILDLLR